MRSLVSWFGAVMLFAAVASVAQGQQRAGVVSTPLGENGRIAAWLVNGPYDQPLVGFGVPSDFSPLGDVPAEPAWARDFRLEGADWFLQPTDSRGFVDFNEILAWSRPGPGPEKIWEARAAYAFTNIVSDKGGEATLYLGGNSRMKAVLNGVTVYQSDADENAVPDAQAVKVQLKPGDNPLFVRTTQSHQNIGIVIFAELSYDWGFYARVEAPGQVLGTSVDANRMEATATVQSTLFYKEIDGAMYQRHDLFLQNPSSAQTASLEAVMGGERYPMVEEPLAAGVHRLELWLPEVPGPTRVDLNGTLAGRRFSARVQVKPQPKYTLHLMPLSHTDIGYTHTQPIVKEIHMRTLDEVVEICAVDPDYRWTLETLWPLEAYREGRSEAQFGRLIDLIRDGRIAVSPFYTNPFTGMVDAEEMIRSLDKAAWYREHYGIEFKAAIYNDVPGQSWLLPQLLRDQGISFLANGLNEVYGNYVMQQALPKVFHWQGADGSKVLYYRTESYNEGQAYGLERGNPAIAHRMWMRISRLQKAGYPTSHILLNAAFGDNLGIARRQWDAHKRWNGEYAWPKFKASTLADFASVMESESVDQLPTVRGDATSDWDIFFQGEPERMQRYRQNQHLRAAAEALATAGSLMEPRFATFDERLGDAMDRQLEYSGHGSGLEFGYGTDHENAVTLGFRESYVAEATQDIEEVIERAAFRWLQPQAALEGQYAVVFNPHAFPVTWPVSVEFNPLRAAPYAVEDAATGDRVASHWGDFTLSFVAADLPPLGWKKFRLVGREPSDDTKPTGLQIAETSLENGLVRIELDRATGALVRYSDTRTGEELASPQHPMFQFQVSRGGNDKPFGPVDLPAAKIRIEDRSPVSVSLHVERPGTLLPTVIYTLYHGQASVHVSVDVDLRQLQPTDLPEAYGVMLPVAIADAGVQVETIGGFIDGRRDRMPGTTPSVFSMREALAVSDGKRTLHVASPDNRVTFVQKTEGGLPMVISNVVNHFPDNWNRREENDAVLRTRFVLQTRTGGFDPGFSHRFGQVAAQPLWALQGWYTGAPATASALSLSAEHSTLQALVALGPQRSDGVLLRLRNMHPLAPDALILDAPWLSEGQLCAADLTGRTCEPLALEGASLRFTLQPNEIRTLRWTPGPPLQSKP